MGKKYCLKGSLHVGAFVVALAVVLTGSLGLPAHAADGDFVWAQQMGGSGDDAGYGMAVDSSGNVYTTGVFRGTVDFDPGAGTANLTAVGDGDIFASKLDSSGGLVWAKQMGGSLQEHGNSVALDASGSIYIIGEFNSTADFDPGPGTANLTAVGNQDIFVSKLDSSGAFVWAKQMGSSMIEGVTMVADSSGNVYTTGRFGGTTDFDPGAGTANLTAAGSWDVFVSKLDSSGAFVWAEQIGGIGIETGRSVAVDSSGNVYTTGVFRGTVDFDPGAGTANLTAVGNQDIFVSKLDRSGAFVWAKQMGGSGVGASSSSMALDGSDNVYTTGDFQGTVDFDPGAATVNLTAVGGRDIFVSKLDSSGGFIWAKQMGGSLDAYGDFVAVDNGGNVYTTGQFQGTVDFDPGAATVNLTAVGNYDISVSKLDSSGGFIWAKQMGGSLDEVGLAMAFDNRGNVYTTGFFEGTVDFDPGASTANLTAIAGEDIFVAKLSGDLPALPLPWWPSCVALAAAGLFACCRRRFKKAGTER